MSKMAPTEVCIECGHPIGQHFQSVDGKVRCLHVEHRVSDKGITGIHFQVHCDCTDYRSENNKSRLAKALEGEVRR